MGTQFFDENDENWLEDPQVLRRIYTFGIVMGIVLSVIGLAVLGSAWHDYRTLGTQPINLTAREAVPSPSTTPEETRWVQLTGLSVPDCKNFLSGSANEKEYLATDESKERYFFLTTKADQDCEELALPLAGILKKADPALPGWLKEKGMTVPDSKYPLMDFTVGASASSAKMMVEGGSVLFLFAIITTAALLRKRQQG